MKTVDWKTASNRYLEGGKLDEKEFDALRKENLAILQKMKISIETMKEPFRPKVLHFQRAWMGLLPWRTLNPGK